MKDDFKVYTLSKTGLSWALHIDKVNDQNVSLVHTLTMDVYKKHEDK